MAVARPRLGTIPTARPPEPFARPRMAHAIRDARLYVLTAEGEPRLDFADEQGRSKVYLLNPDNPRVAYQREGREGRPNSTRGWILTCRILQRIDDDTYIETNEFVKVKKWPRQRLDRDLAQGGVSAVAENPYSELYISQTYGDDHHLPKCRECLQDARNLYMVMTFYNSGTLLDSVPPGGFLASRNYDPRPLILRLAEDLCYIHSRALVHRDVCPEHVLFHSTDEQDCCLLIDFVTSLRVKLGPTGQTAHYIEPQELITGCPAYRSPEIARIQPFGQPVDVWCLGGVLFFMLTGMTLYQRPYDRCFAHFCFGGGLTSDAFNQRLEEVLLRGGGGKSNALAADPILKRLSKLHEMSPNLRDLLSRMLQIHATRRITPQEIVEHAWFDQDDPF